MLLVETGRGKKKAERYRRRQEKEKRKAEIERIEKRDRTLLENTRRER